MKLIRLLPILLLIGLSCLTSCQKEEIPSADNERTLFMYLPWSTNLTNYFYQNIDDMEDAISRRGLDKERVLVFLSTSSTEAELFEITVNNGTCTRQILKEYTRPAFTTEEGLTGILKDEKNCDLIYGRQRDVPAARLCAVLSSRPDSRHQPWTHYQGIHVLLV